MFAAPDDDAAGRGRFIPDDYAAMMPSVPCSNLAEEIGEFSMRYGRSVTEYPVKTHKWQDRFQWISTT